ncbi:MAG: PAS domain-containing protein [Stigonema ocellatum SAG 48.90 = DSM 106950]|nr:PAS domain-containing protein [Stigonema ocellatum SAG 48.90 = DSM 106950]
MNRISRTLLIVDDSPEDRELYRRCLLCDKNYSYTIVEAALGQQGLDLWHQHKPDAVLVDHCLPDLDGLEFLRRLQPSSLQLSVPVIMLTGQGNEAIAVQAMKAGAQDYLVKGKITPKELQLAVNGAIEVVQIRTQLQQRIERERLVWQIIQKIQQTLELEEILQTTVSEVRQFLQTDRVLVFRVEPDGNGKVVAESVGSQWRSLLYSTIYDPCLAGNYLRFSRPESVTHDLAFSEDYVKRYRQGQVTAISDIHNSSIDPCHVELLAQFQVQANLVVPIVRDNEFWGLLIAHHCAAPRSWQPLEIDLLKELATAVSIALRQAKLYQQGQHELAERQQAEAELRESEQRYATLAQISPVGIFRTDAHGDCQYVNTRWCELAGLSIEEAKGKGWIRAIHPDDRDRVVGEWYRAAALNLPFVSEYRFQTAGGVVSWLMGQAIAEKDIEGNVIGYVGTITDITDRKQTEQALQASEERLRVAQAASRIGTWDWNIQTGQISWSENLEALFGLEPGAFDGSYEMFASLLHPDDRHRVQASVHHAMTTGAAYNIEFRVVYPNGTIRWALAQGKVFYDQNGQPIRMAGIDIDITERKRSEAALQESEERFRQLAENIDAVFWMKELPENRVCYVSSAYERLWGLIPQELYGKPDAWFDYIHPEDQELIAKAFQQNATTGQFDQEYRIVLPDGSVRWVRDRCFPLKDHTGSIYRLAGIAEDITDRKQIEETLHKNEQQLRLALAGAQAGSWDWNIQTGSMVWSPENYDLYGVNPANSLTWYEDWSNALHPDDRERVTTSTLRLVEQRVPEYQTEFRIIHPQRGIRWLLALGRLTLNEQGYPIRLSGINLDFTERKQAEIERDRLLEQEQAARAQADRANRIKDEFLSVLSHELRSPLNPILGWTKLLQTRKFDQTRTAEALATIERNARLQTQLIDDLLDVAKILRGKLSMDIAPVDLVFVIESALDTVRTAAVSKSIGLHPVLPQIGRVSGDAGRLQQVVWNLLSNAIKFTPNNGRVDIWLEQVGNQAQITVSDTGIGINPNFLPHIFESFHQEDASITRKYGGLGLGLAIVRTLVEAHGGTICANSPGVGKGAIFTVRLPLLDTQLETRQPDELPAQDLDLTGIRVLAVDDEPDARELLTILLTQYGAEVLTVASAAEVLTALESFQPDALVSDIGMPEIDGYTLIQQIRALPPEKGGRIPAIALTAYARVEDHQRAITSGYQQQVTKPLEPEQLVLALITLCRVPI